MEAILIVAVVTGVLYGLWTLLGFTFDHIDQWHAALREKREVLQTREGKRSSDSP